MTQSKLNKTWTDIYEKYDNIYNISKKEYEAILKLTNKLCMEAVIETGYELRFPLRLGTLYVQRQKPKCNPIDLNHYMKTGEKVYHRNRHSHGYMARFKWDKSMRNATFPYRAAFEFLPTRSAKNHLSKCIKEKNTIIKYMEYDKSVYIH